METCNEDCSHIKSAEKNLHEDNVPRRQVLRIRKQPVYSQETPVKKKKSAAEACKDYREKLKESPFYAEIKKFNNLRIKTY